MAVDPLADLFAEGGAPERDSIFAAATMRGVARARMLDRTVTAGSVAAVALVAVGAATLVGELLARVGDIFSGLGADVPALTSPTAILLLTACGLGAAWMRANA